MKCNYNLFKRVITASLLTAMVVGLFTPADTFSADTTRTKIAPGFYFHRIDDPSKPLRIFAMEINISRPNVSIRSALANDELGSSFENTLSMARRYDKEDHEVVTAINGDYFGISDPTNPYSFLSNLMIMDEEYVNGKSYSRSQFLIDREGIPFVDMVSFSGKAHLPYDVELSLDGVNRQRRADQAIVYNRFIGSDTRTNEHGDELLLKPLDEPAFGQLVRFEVVDIERGQGSMTIPDDSSYVLSVHGAKRSIVRDTVETGDIIGLELGVDIDRDDIATLVGGGPQLITDGEFPDTFRGLEGFQEGHNMYRHPRTAVGISEDTTRVYFMVVEGRQDASRGATMKETAHYIHDLGAWNAVNLDGGGSSTIIVKDTLTNRPNGGSWQRPVGNALLAIAEPYEGEEQLGAISIHPTEIVVEVGQSFNFDISGEDLYGDEMDVSVQEIDWEIVGLEANYGRGGFLAQDVGEGYVVAHYQEEFSDTAYVTIVDDVSGEPETELPASYHLEQNYPNPFNPDTRIQYDLPEQSHVRLTIYNILGQTVRTLVNRQQDPGTHTETFDAGGLSSGTYIYELSAGPYTKRKKMMLVK